MTEAPVHLIDELAARGPVLTDGAWGTQLSARGLPPGEFAECWNLTQPERVEHVSLAADPQFQEVFVDELGFPP